MRTYPCNSPETAARIVALILISDGHVSRSEYEALTQFMVCVSWVWNPGETAIGKPQVH